MFTVQLMYVQDTKLQCHPKQFVLNFGRVIKQKIKIMITASASVIFYKNKLSAGLNFNHFSDEFLESTLDLLRYQDIWGPPYSINFTIILGGWMAQYYGGHGQRSSFALFCHPQSSSFYMHACTSTNIINWYYHLHNKLLQQLW